MRRTFATLSSLAGLLIAAAVPLRAAEVIDPAEVPAGSRGVCVTEMDGGERMEIPVTVLGIVGPYAPELDMVLVRLDHPRFEKTGIIAGMSGSPVYVDGRLLGALAYGWGFSKEPIGGVTPFTRMAELAAAGTASPSPAGSVSVRPSLPQLVQARQDRRLDALLLDWLAPAAAGGVRPLPLAISTTGPGALPASGWLAELWNRRGWVSGPGAAAGDGSDAGPLVPGAMVAGVLADGDVTLAAGGTVTEVRGDQVWAFGHPFTGGGRVEMPLARARVVTVLPSALQSMKFFSVGDGIGAIEVDSTHGIWGLLGRATPMVPLEVVVDDRGYSFRALRHGILLPSIVGYLSNTSLSARGRSFGDQTVEMAIELAYGGATASLEETFSGPDAGLQAAGMAAAAVGFLENSSFERPTLDAIRIRLDSVQELDTMALVSATPARWVVRPGETLPVTLRLRPHRGPELTEVVEVEVPAGVDAGRLDLVVADGASWTAYDLAMRPPKAASFEHEVAMFDRLVSSRRVVLAFEHREVGVVLPGGTLSVPPSVAVQMRSGLGTNLKTTEYGVVAVTERELPAALSGAERLPLTVRLEERDNR